MRTQTLIPVLVTALLTTLATSAVAQYSDPQPGDYILRDFKFNSGETLPELVMHYETIGRPVRDEHEIVRNAVLILHGTTGSAGSFRGRSWAGELYGPGHGIGDALAKGAERLRDIEATSKVMILLSDGANNYGHLKPSEAATIAKSFDIKVYTIGIGQSGVIMEKVMSLFGPMMRPRQSDLDEATLEAIAAATGGKYYNAASTDALKEVYEEIDALEKTEIISERFYRWDEKFQGWALAALGLLVVEVLLGQTLFRRLP